MKRIFEADKKELSDLRGDPNIILKVQNLIKEAFHASEQRKKGISNEIEKDYGTHALPGIISSTYIYAQDFSRNNKMCEWVINLLFNMVKNNDAARKLLVISGLSHSPFKETQNITLDVLFKLDKFELSYDEIEELELLANYDRLGQDPDIIIKVIEILLNLNPEYYFNLSFGLINKLLDSNIKKDIPSASKLIDIVINRFCDKSYEVFSTIFYKIDGRDSDADKFSTISLSQENVRGFFIASNEILTTGNRKSNTVVELIFKNSLSRLLKKYPALIEEWHNKIVMSYPRIIRYWMQAVGDIFPKDYVVNYFKKHSLVNESEVTKWIVVQLLFKKGYEAEKILNEIQDKNPSGYEAGNEQYKKMNPKIKTERERVNKEIIDQNIYL